MARPSRRRRGAREVAGAPGAALERRRGAVRACLRGPGPGSCLSPGARGDVGCRDDIVVVRPEE